MRQPYFGMQHKDFLCTFHFITQNSDRYILKGWDLIRCTTSSRTFLSKLMFVFLKLLVPYGATVLIRTGLSSFTHYHFCIFSANVIILKKTNNVLVLLWKWWLFHGHYLTLHAPHLKNHCFIHYSFPVTCPASVCHHHLCDFAYIVPLPTVSLASQLAKSHLSFNTWFVFHFWEADFMSFKLI